jgi:hypothetical protein
MDSFVGAEYEGSEADVVYVGRSCLALSVFLKENSMAPTACLVRQAHQADTLGAVKTAPTASQLDVCGCNLVDERLYV